ncbi:MAG: YkgJ family cysteine cluster protein [Promethearchaeota archaeon]|jgi:Fe-S-cluster containining protein
MLNIEVDDEIYVGDKLLQEFTSCLDCGLCCKLFDWLPIYDEEINELVSTLEIKKTDFKKKYTKLSNNDKKVNYLSLRTPCPFQNGNECQIYNKRWLICRTFPFCINLTKNIAELTGIYVCPQATQFYIAMLDFYETYQPDIYHKLIEKENQGIIGKNGMRILGPADIFTNYLDWLYLKNRDRIQFS